MNKRDFRILVVDDDDIVREVISSILSKEGYAVIPAKDGLEAIKNLMSDDISMVITDFKMPRADGLDVLKNAMRINRNIAVVILTAYGTLDGALEAIAAGAYDYLTKPFKVQEVIIVVEKAFQRMSMIKENQELVEQLRDTYRDIKLLKTVADSRNPEITTRWLERVERLKTMDVLTVQEAGILKERLINGNGRENSDS
ncbi:MAG: response regulator [Nitrospiraceae bacterium]|nr:response regulator [Nitrospiraceae bacterium]